MVGRPKAVGWAGIQGWELPCLPAGSPACPAVRGSTASIGRVLRGWCYNPRRLCSSLSISWKVTKYEICFLGLCSFFSPFTYEWSNEGFHLRITSADTSVEMWGSATWFCIFSVTRHQPLPHSGRQVDAFAERCTGSLSLSMDGGKCTRYRMKNAWRTVLKAPRVHFWNSWVTLRFSRSLQRQDPFSGF